MGKTINKKICLWAMIALFVVWQSCTDEMPEGLKTATPIQQSIEHEYVDMGLSVCWATCNLGAESIEEFGDFVAWGELASRTSGYGSWTSYKYYTGTGFTKYNRISVYGNDGFVDNKTKLEPNDDVATVLWGDGWRLPTRDEFDELVNNCTWMWMQIDGVNGYVVTSCIPGYTDRSIFLPCAGGLYSSGRSNVNAGFYWSSETSDCPTKVWNLNIDIDKYSIGDDMRLRGYSVRPVKSLPHTDETSIFLSRSALCIEAGGVDSLTATLKRNYEMTESDVRWTSSDSKVATVSASGHLVAVSPGTCTITAMSGAAKAECRVDVIASSVMPQMVDLGLSVKWATFNVGAGSPEQVGYYFAWGESERKPAYNWVTYKHCDGSFSNNTIKYCSNSEWGVRDDRYTVEPEDDAATAAWGSGWRMPTPYEIYELCGNCIWTWTTVNGMAGYKVTSNVPGYTDSSIFIPAAGVCGIDSQMGVGLFGHYWSSSILDAGWVAAWKLLFHNGETKLATDNRNYGYPIRPVYNEPVQTAVPEPIDLGLSVNWASFNLGASTPGEYGDYLSWGEIKEKETYTTYSYRYQRDEFLKMIENDNISGTQYDAAHVRLGGDWRMPTKEECQELVDNCTWSWEQFEGGTYGMKVTGPNGNSIFLPAGGYPNPSWIDVGSYGTYWTSSKSTYRSSSSMGSNTSYYFRFNRSMHDVTDDEGSTYVGQLVRPVCP